MGAQGLNLDSSAIRISDNISEFANYVVRFLANPRERRLQEQNALQYAKSFPMWNQVIGDTCAAMQKCLRTVNHITNRNQQDRRASCQSLKCLSQKVFRAWRENAKEVTVPDVKVSLGQ